MPIAFPPARIGSVFDDVGLLYRKPFDVVPAPNLGRPGIRFNAQSLNPGIPLTKARPNVRRLGTMYAAVSDTAKVNPVNVAITDNRVYLRVLAGEDGNRELRGVSRDSVGVALGSCRVMLFRTEDNSFVKETTSDGSGNWAMSVMSAGAFFIVYYKAGGTDLAGTTKNNLTTVQGNGGA